MSFSVSGVINNTSAAGVRVVEFGPKPYGHVTTMRLQYVHTCMHIVHAYILEGINYTAHWLDIGPN